MTKPTDGRGLFGLRAGSRFGHYQLHRLLGEGGFGQVWEAEDTVMDRVVAIKLLKPAYSDDESFRQRLFREARAAGRLHEPHVVPVHQCGEIEGQLYIDMRLMRGADLQSVLANNGPLQPKRAVAVVRQIAAALDAAHAAGLVHRDVKPANILLTDDDFASLLDFGIANAATDAKLTSTGFMVGTYAYMPPERLSAGELDHRVDVYALACVLYECLTGSTPYTMSDPAAVITAHLSAPVPRPSQQRPRIPAAFDDVIARGMAKSPQDRYNSAGELAAAARQALAAPRPGIAPTAFSDTQAATSGAPTVAANVPQPAHGGVGAHTFNSHSQMPKAYSTPSNQKHSARVSTVVLAGIVAVILLVVLAVTIAINSSSPDSSATQASTSSRQTWTSPPSPTSVPRSQSTATGTSTNSAPGISKTIADYIRDNNIREIPAHYGDPGSPTINLPVPNGWHTLPEGSGAPYGGIVSDAAADPNDAPTVVAIVSKLDGQVDPAKILQYAPGELKNLPEFEGGTPNGKESTLGVPPGETYKAWQFGGSYVKNGKKRTVAQKTVVITGPNGLYVLQIDADALDAETSALIDATNAIDEQTTITP